MSLLFHSIRRCNEIFPQTKMKCLLFQQHAGKTLPCIVQVYSPAQIFLLVTHCFRKRLNLWFLIGWAFYHTLLIFERISRALCHISFFEGTLCKTHLFCFKERLCHSFLFFLSNVKTFNHNLKIIFNLFSNNCT